MVGGMDVIDAHSHLPLDTDDAVTVLEGVGGGGVSVINICVDSGQLGGLDAQRGWYRSLVQQHPKRFGWVTSFPLDGFGSSGWAESCIAQLDTDFAAGACGCKVWKNVGMELRDSERGDWVFCDDPRFDPIYEHLSAVEKPLLMHIGEPLACWTSIDQMERDRSPHLAYYRQCPQWHWHGRAGVPTHSDLIASRDRVAERHPGLTVVGAHYGSLEYSIDEVAKRLRRYPNFVVDTSARLGDIALQAALDRERVRDFFMEFSGRVLWGLDWVLTTPTSQLEESARREVLTRLAAAYEQEFAFFAGAQPVEINGGRIAGLELPADVLRAMFHDNAMRVYGLSG